MNPETQREERRWWCGWCMNRADHRASWKTPPLTDVRAHARFNISEREGDFYGTREGGRERDDATETGGVDAMSNTENVTVPDEDVDAAIFAWLDYEPEDAPIRRETMRAVLAAVYPIWRRREVVLREIVDK